MSLQKYKSYMLFLLTIATSLVFSSVSFAMYDPGQLSIQVIQRPAPIPAANQYFLAYELQLVNYQKHPIRLNALEVWDPDHKQLVFQFDTPVLSTMIRAIGRVDPDEESPLVLQPGMAKILLVWLPFTNLNAVPEHLQHKIIFTELRSSGRDFSRMTLSNPSPVSKTPPLVISSPVAGNHWLAANALSRSSKHRSVNAVLNGHIYFPYRYAIDFVKIGRNGLTYQYDQYQNTSYFSYKKRVFAVAPGRVISVTDGIPENIPHSGNTAIPITFTTVAGNQLILDLGNHHYACYSHLAPGSFTVKAGDVVQAGQVLAHIGDSGNATEPLLTFHIVDNRTCRGGHAVPYIFKTFDLYPRHIIKEDVPTPHSRIEILPASLEHYMSQLVLENGVMKFPENTATTNPMEDAGH